MFPSRYFTTAMKVAYKDANLIFPFRETLLRLRRENAELRGLLKEQKSTECKEKESADASGESSDGQAELRRSLETLQSDSQSGSSVTDGSSAPVVSSTDGMVNLQIKNLSHRRSAKHRVLWVFFCYGEALYKKQQIITFLKRKCIHIVVVYFNRRSVSNLDFLFP